MNESTYAAIANACCDVTHGCNAASKSGDRSERNSGGWEQESRGGVPQELKDWLKVCIGFNAVTTSLQFYYFAL